MIKVRMRVYSPDWNTNFMDHLPPAHEQNLTPTEGEQVKQAVAITHPATKTNKKVGAK